MAELSVAPRPHVNRRGGARRRLLAGAGGALALVVAALTLAVQIRAGQWLGEMHDGTFLATAARVWVNRGVQGGLVLVTVSTALRMLWWFRQLGSEVQHRGLALALGAIFALPVAYLLISAGNDLGSVWLADSPLPGSGSDAPTPYPPAGPAAARLLFHPTDKGLALGPTASTLTACARSDGAFVAAHAAGDDGPLLVVERVVLFPTAAQAESFHASGGTCGVSSEDAGFRRTPLSLRRIDGVDAATAYRSTAVGTAAHGDTDVSLRLLVGTTEISAIAGLSSTPTTAPTLVQVEQLERILVDAATQGDPRRE